MARSSEGHSKVESAQNGENSLCLVAFTTSMFTSDDVLNHT